MIGFCVLACVALTPVEIPFSIGDSAILIDTKVNGRPATLMFDTGFSGSVVISGVLDIGKPTGTMTLRDFVGQFEARTVPIQSLHFGSSPNLAPKDGQAVQVEGGDMTLSYNMHTDGILGLEPFTGHVLEISFETKRLRLHPKSFDVTQRRPDGQKTFLNRMLPIGHDSIEMRAVLDTGGRMTLALDTGNAGYATTHRDVLERIGVWPRDRAPAHVGRSGIASGVVESWDLELPSMKIFGVPVEKSVWNVIDLPSSSAEGDGTVGFQFLKNFNIVLDPERRVVWMENFTGRVSEPAKGSTGLWAYPDSKTKRMEVTFVTDSSPAARAGIRVGDHLLEIDGTAAAGLSFREMDALLDGEEDSEVRLVLSRRGQLIRHTLKRQILVNKL